jgi:predicted ATP-dependent endonuclease of OLD family
MQKIEINNLGPIKNLSLDIKDFTLFIGPQASGKSTIAKAIFFFKSLSDDLAKYFIKAFEQNEDYLKAVNSYTKIVRQKYLDYFGSSIHLEDLSLKYYYTKTTWVSITLEKSHSYITPTFSPALLGFIKNLAEQSGIFSESLSQGNKSLLTSRDLLMLEDKKKEFASFIKNQCETFFNDDRELIFIPAGRSLLAVLADQFQYINPKRLDFLMRVFVERINLLKPMFNKSLGDLIKERRLLTQLNIDYGRTKLAENIINDILKGKYQYDKDGEKIYYETGRYVKLSLSSSGQQESLWILLLLFIIILEQQKVFVVIEEPEAHLFPEAQKEITALIALMANVKQSQVIITTHSPYILASINNLILAHEIGKIHVDEVAKKIDKRLWIDRENVFAGFVQSGVVTDIIDSELNLIQQERIDTISSSINEEFDYLYLFKENAYEL